MFPCLGLDRSDSRIPMPDPVHYAVLVAHIFAATVALVLGPLQFLPRVRAHRRLHRTVGRGGLLAGVLPAALTAIPVAHRLGAARHHPGKAPGIPGEPLTQRAN